MYLHRADRVDKLLLLLKKYEPIQSHHFMSRYFVSIIVLILVYNIFNELGRIYAITSHLRA